MISAYTKKVLVIAGVIALAFLSVLLILRGKTGLDYIGRLFLKLRVLWVGADIELLDKKAAKETNRVDQNAELIKALEGQRKTLVTDRKTKELQIEGMSNEAIADELRKLGY
jgi:hypothetical protein